MSAPQSRDWALLQRGRMCLSAVGLGRTQTCQAGIVACQCKLGPVQGLQEQCFSYVKANPPIGGNEPVPRKPPWQHECAIFMQIALTHEVSQQPCPGNTLAPCCRDTRDTQARGAPGDTWGRGDTRRSTCSGSSEGGKQLPKPSLAPASAR